MISRYSRIRETLEAAFSPSSLEIVDESAKHARHAALKNLPAGETHFHVVMVSAAFTGQSRVVRARAVHQALDAEFKTGLHALSLNLAAPLEKAAGS